MIEERAAAVSTPPDCLQIKGAKRMGQAGRGHLARRLAGLALVATLLGAAVPAAEETPVSVALVLDTSGSLRKKDQALRRRLAEGVLRDLPAESDVSVFAFDDRPRLVVPRTTERQKAVQGVRALRTRGRSTTLYEAVFDASRYLGQEAEGRRAILLVTDGLDEGSAVNLEDAVSMARELRVPVFAVGVGRAQGRVLRRIAKLTGGEYFSPRVRPSALAARILAVTAEAPAPRPPAVEVPVPPVRPPARTAATPAPAETLPEAPATAPRPALGARAVPWALAAAVLLGGLLLAGAAGAIIFFALTRRKAPAGAFEVRPAEEPDEEPFTPRPREPHAQTTLVLTLMPLLRVTKGPSEGRMFEVSATQATSLGRSKANDVVLDDRAVSNHHCRIRPGAGGVFELFDLKSTNGTFVNQRRVSRHTLGPGDVIKIGETTMEFRMDHMKEE